jgi:hypothetical protein
MHNINSAIRQGHGHIFEEKPCQDSFFIHQNGSITIAIVSDGCSSGVHSEVGANLLSYLCGNYILSYVEKYPDKDITEILNITFNDLIIHILNSIPVGMYDVDVIENFWLATLLGVVIYRDKCYVFNCGDGIYYINNEYVAIDQNNCPQYLAYAAISNPAKVMNLDMVPKGFDIKIFDVCDKIMIATDGFENHKPNLESLRDKQWNKTQAQFTKWCRLSFSKGYFYDDCTIITLEKQ